MEKVLKPEHEMLIMAKMLALYSSLALLPSDNRIVERAKDAYLDLEEILDSSVGIKIRKKSE